MWPFRQQVQPQPSVDLVERMETLERRMRDLSLDWDTTYEKFAGLAARLAKRAKHAAEEGTGEQETNGRPSAGLLAGGRAAAIQSTNPLARQLLGG